MGRRKFVALAWVGILAGACVASPALAEQPDQGTPSIDAAKIEQDIKTMCSNGLTTGAIKYVLDLDGITVPDTVLSGSKTVQDGITDGTVTKGTAPTTWTPPAMQPTPAPDLAPKGSSASGWSSNVQTPSIQQMRQTITSRTRPPNC
jgi:hypothetical protein